MLQVGLLPAQVRAATKLHCGREPVPLTICPHVHVQLHSIPGSASLSFSRGATAVCRSSSQWLHAQRASATCPSTPTLWRQFDRCAVACCCSECRDVL